MVAFYQHNLDILPSVRGGMKRTGKNSGEKDPARYHYLEMPDDHFPLDVFKRIRPDKGQVFGEHWHEHLQFFLFSKGHARIRCSGKDMIVGKGDILTINANEMHYGENLGGTLEFYLIRIDFNLLLSHQPDLCQTKYIQPLAHNRILFKNRIIGDPLFAACIKKIIKEHHDQRPGFELALKALIYEAIVFLLRGHLKSIETEEECGRRLKLMDRFNDLIIYLETHYQEKTDLDRMAEIANLSKHHFCRLFKQLTGHAPGDYLNRIRIRKAAELLRENAMSVTEAAKETGFDDVNYFSRCFKKYEKASPSQLKAGRQKR